MAIHNVSVEGVICRVTVTPKHGTKNLWQATGNFEDRLHIIDGRSEANALETWKEVAGSIYRSS